MKKVFAGLAQQCTKSSRFYVAAFLLPETGFGSPLRQFAESNLILPPVCRLFLQLKHGF